MTLKTYFSHASLVIYYLATPPIKLKLGVQQIGGGLLIANHVEPIIMIDQSEILSSSTRINLLHSFHRVPVPSATHHKHCAIMWSQNYFSEPNPQFF
jgi:hypothetical protein